VIIKLIRALINAATPKPVTRVAFVQAWDDILGLRLQERGNWTQYLSA
jgi:hypothetical protein